MDHRIKFSALVAAPVAAAAACAWILMPAAPIPVASAPPAVVEHCKLAAELLYEVTWAAACMRDHEDSNDCMLPNDQAAKVNSILATEEARCMTAELQARASP